MKINGIDVHPDMSHEQVAQVMYALPHACAFLPLARLVERTREQYPTPEALRAFVENLIAQLESAATPPEGPYTVLDHGHAIRCNTCMKTSWNSTDVLRRYCGHCQQFHREPT